MIERNVGGTWGRPLAIYYRSGGVWRWTKGCHYRDVGGTWRQTNGLPFRVINTVTVGNLVNIYGFRDSGVGSISPTSDATLTTNIKDLYYDSGSGETYFRAYGTWAKNAYCVWLYSTLTFGLLTFNDSGTAWGNVGGYTEWYVAGDIFDFVNNVGVQLPFQGVSVAV